MQAWVWLCGLKLGRQDDLAAVLRARIRSMFDDAVIQEAGRRILEAAPPNSRVILFGSHARGEAGKHSDLDFLVIEPSVEHRAEESVRLRSVLNPLEVFADIIVVSEESVREWRDVYGHVIHSALSEGRELTS
jgi:predicted nucleotidyltransferase